MSVLFRRPDETFVIEHPSTGMPYHVIPGDPLFDEYADAAQAADLEPEPLPLVLPGPKSITRRQCAKQMLAMGIITAPEALAMTRNGTPPAMVEPMFAQMQPADAVLAEIDFAADTYVRSNPLLIALMTATGATREAIDDFFQAASAL